MPSLLNDPLTHHMWRKVQNPNSFENAAQSFWHHIYTKDIFAHRKYAVDYEEPPIPEEQNKRKVDQIVKMLEPIWGDVFVLLFHEIKRTKCDDAELEWLETQAYTACESYCKKHNIPQVYAQTSVGSCARFFLYKPGSWTPVDNRGLGDFTAYQEFGTPAGEAYILQWLTHIKNQGPSLPAPYVLHPIPSKTQSNGTCRTWVLDTGRQKYYYLTPLYYVYADGTMAKRQ
jgi:hypothetical protein